MTTKEKIITKSIAALERISFAAECTGRRRADISAVCNGKQKTAFGFIWRFKQNTI